MRVPGAFSPRGRIIEISSQMFSFPMHRKGAVEGRRAHLPFHGSVSMVSQLFLCTERG